MAKEKKTGRPKWMPPDLKQVEQYAKMGLEKKEIAAVLGIHYDTLNERVKEFSEFSDAIDRGYAKQKAAILAGFMKNAITKGNVQAQIFFLKTRGGWKEAQDAPTSSQVILVSDAKSKLFEKLVKYAPEEPDTSSDK